MKRIVQIVGLVYLQVIAALATFSRKQLRQNVSLIVRASLAAINLLSEKGEMPQTFVLCGRSFSDLLLNMICFIPTARW